MSAIRSILITRPLSEVPQLEAFCQAHGIRLVAESFIDFAAVRANVPADVEVLFFGSKQAVDFFLQTASGKILGQSQIACIGHATAAHLEKLGYHVDFAGTKSGDPASVAQELKSWLGDRKLHVALSEQSKRSIAKALPKDQVEEIIVYRTITVPKTIKGPLDLIAFTSPSNLQGFLEQNQISSPTKIVAWGKTTEKSLHELDFHADFVLGNASETELISILESLI